MASWKELQDQECKARDRQNTSDFEVNLQTERLVNVFTALAVVEEVLLDIITDGEQRAASCVGGCVHSVGASDTPDDGT